MRADALGLFWRDEPPKPKEKKEKEKRLPPEPVWLEDDYLPHLEEALKFNVPLLTDDELVQLSYEKLYSGEGHLLIFDVECYVNYFLVAFYSPKEKKYTYIEFDRYSVCDSAKLHWITQNFTLKGFNSGSYDITMVTLAISGRSTIELKVASGMLIEDKMWPTAVLKHFKVSRLQNVQHVDIMEVAPLRASLKLYGGRVHTKRMQDLPFPHDIELSLNQIAVLRWYCINDLHATKDLDDALTEPLNLRRAMSLEYGVDLMSKSDAQIAEAVIGHELEKLNGYRCSKPSIEIGTSYRYNVPEYLKFQTPLMQSVLETVKQTDFVVDETGSIAMPKTLSGLKLVIGGTTYTMGIGGLHSCEKAMVHHTNKTHFLVDRDVASYYPRIILNQGLYPQHLGPNFLVVYNTIVERRLAAKAAGDKLTASTLKIVINGSYGKLGSMYSILYSPDLLIQVTLTGQLSLLLLIETLELAGIPVVSGNTDGIVIKCPRSKEKDMDAIVAWWERVTQFETEATYYSALYSRDVNNYVAVMQEPKGDEKAKTKGAFAYAGLSKNPANEVCIDAVVNLLTDGVPVQKTLTSCNDIRKFLNVRTVSGGAVKDGEFLGKAIRWYYAKDEGGEIVYAKNGNKVPKSDGAKPVMDLPDKFPGDVDYERYLLETEKMLKSVGWE